MNPTARVHAAYARIAEVDRPEIWIALRSREQALIEAAAVQRRLDAGEVLPLAGRTVAVKDNIDVAAMPTTAGCPAFAYEPERTAVAVERLTRAGAIVIGKTNMDQFATGLVGTRSPYGAVRDARRPAYVSGGRARARPSPWRWASPTSRWAPTPPARAGCRPHSPGSSGSSPRAASFPPPAWCRHAARWTACRSSPPQSRRPRALWT